MQTNSIIDFVTKINGAKAVQIKYIDINLSKKTMKIMFLLYEVGIFRRLKLLKTKGGIRYRIYFKYTKKAIPAFDKLYLVNKPGRKVNFSLNKLNKYKNDSFNRHIFILSTARGLLLDRDCVRYHLGGVPIIAITLI